MSGEWSKMRRQFDRKQTNLGKGLSRVGVSIQPSNAVVDAMAMFNDFSAKLNIPEVKY